MKGDLAFTKVPLLSLRNLEKDEINKISLVKQASVTQLVYQLSEVSMEAWIGKRRTKRWRGLKGLMEVRPK